MDINEIHGWFNYGDYYDKIVKNNKSNKNLIFVEVGVWLGKSVIYLADKVKKNDVDVTVYAVDNFCGSQIESGGNHVTKSIAQEKYNGDFYNEFIENIKNFNVDDIIKPMKMDSVKASEEFDNESIDFVFIDADHSYDGVIRDITAWYPKVKNGGIISGHDYHHPPVVDAINDFIKGKNLSINKVSNNSWEICKK